MNRKLIGSFFLFLVFSFNLMVCSSQAQLPGGGTGLRPGASSAVRPPSTNTTIRVTDEVKATGSLTTSIAPTIPDATVFLRENRYNPLDFLFARTNRAGEAYFNLQAVEYNCWLAKRGYKTKLLPGALLRREGNPIFNVSLRRLKPFPAGKMTYLNCLVGRGTISGMTPTAGILVEVRPESLTASEISDYGVQGISGPDGKVRLRVPAAASNLYILGVDENRGKLADVEISADRFKILPSGDVQDIHSDVGVPTPVWLVIPE